MAADVFIHQGHALAAPVRDAVVVNFSADPFAQELFDSSCRVVDYGSYLSPADLRAILDEGYVRGQAWHSGLPEAVSTYEGISLGAVAAYDFVGAFIEAVKALRLAHRIIDVEKPAALRLVDDGGVTSRAMAAVCLRRGVEVTRVAGLDAGRTLLVDQPRLLTWKKRALAPLVSRLQRIVTARPEAPVRLLLPEYFRFTPIIEQFASDPRISLHVVSVDQAISMRRLFQRDGARHLVFSGYLESGAAARLSRFDQRLDEQLGAEPREAGSGPEVDGYALLEICRPVLEDHLRARFRNYAAFVEMCRGVLRRERITHVLVNQDMQAFPKLMVLVGKQAAIATIACQHGLSFNVPHIQEHVADTVAIWGERERDLYRKYGRASANRMRVIGDPAVAAWRGRRYDKSEICRRLGLDPERPIVLLTCERFVNWHSEFERETSVNVRLAIACEAAAQMPSVQLLVRFKQDAGYGEFGDSVELKRRIISRSPGATIVLDAGGNLHERLFAADAVIVGASTIGLEAMLFDKPVIVLGDTAGAETDMVEYAAAGAALRADSVAGLRQALTHCLDGTWRSLGVAEAQHRFIARNVANLEDAEPLARLRDLLLDHDPAMKQGESEAPHFTYA